MGARPYLGRPARWSGSPIAAAAALAFRLGPRVLVRTHELPQIVDEFAIDAIAELRALGKASPQPIVSGSCGTLP